MNSNTVISMPSQLFTMRSSFKAVANGSVYIGEVDTDPTIPTNQIQVYIEQENGTLVPVAQPIKINSAGLLTASGQVQKFVLTNTEYSMTVQNSYGVEQFYFARVYDQGISAALEVEERLLGTGVKIYRGKNGQYVENGDVIPSEIPPYTHLAVPINGKPEDVAMSPIASGAVSLLTETSATIGSTPTYLIRNSDKTLSLRSLGAVGDGITDDSAAFQAALDIGGYFVGHSDDIYYVSELASSKPFYFDGRGCTLKYKRATGVQDTRTFTTWPDGTEYTFGQERLIDIRHKGSIKNVTVDGNGAIYQVDTWYNEFVNILDVRSVDRFDFENVHIKHNNGHAVFIYDCSNVTFTKGSVLDTRAMTGNFIGQEQIAILSSENCIIRDNIVGGYNPGSAIAIVGGRNKIVNGTEYGSDQTFRNSVFYNTFTIDGYDVGESDGYHVVEHNISLSYPAAGEAFGGGVAGRGITVNSGGSIIKNNICYNTATTAQAGIGLGHERISTTGSYVPAFTSSRCECASNVIVGYDNDDNGYGILNEGAEAVRVHHNFISGCRRGINHARYSTNGVYDNNNIEYCVDGMIIGGLIIAASVKAHGNDKQLDIINNRFVNNTRHMAYYDASGWFDGKVSGNKFRDVTPSTEVMIYLNHGYLEFNDNHIITASQADGIVTLFAQDTDSHTEARDNRILCQSSPTADNHEVIKFDGVSSVSVGGRGSLSISGLVIESPDNGNNYNRRVQVQRETPKGMKLSGFNLKNVYVAVSDLLGDIIVSDGKVEVSGTSAFGLVGLITDLSVVTFFKIDNVTFPKVGAAAPIDVNVVAGAGFNVITNCLTLEDKNIASDFTNEARYALANNYKISAGALTAAQV